MLALATASTVQVQSGTTEQALAKLTAALKTVRATKPINTDRDAGPELTPVKQALREWVETQLPPPSKPGRIEGTLDVPDSGSLKQLAAQLTEKLDKASLTCGDLESPSYRCKGVDDFFETERGYVGPVQLGTLYSGSTQFLLLITGVGVQCGQDESVYIYQPEANRWKLVVESEQDDYRRGVYSVQNVTEVALSDSSAESNKAAPLPLVATLGFGPWCSSTWSSLTTRVWRISTATTSPKPLLDRTDGLWWGNGDFGNAELSESDFLVQRVDASMDAGVHHRMHVLHYRVGPDDQLTRIDPLALRPMDFVDEWLTSGWDEASKWLDKPEAGKSFKKAHQEGTADFDDSGKRCRADRSLWQVSLVDGRHFQVRWTAPCSGWSLFHLIRSPAATLSIPPPMTRRPYSRRQAGGPATDLQ